MLGENDIWSSLGDSHDVVLDQTEQRVMTALRLSPSTPKDLIEDLDLSRSAISKATRNLIKEGKIIKEGRRFSISPLGEF